MEFAKYYQNHSVDKKCIRFYFIWVGSFLSAFSAGVEAAEYELLTSQLMFFLNHAT